MRKRRYYLFFLYLLKEDFSLIPFLFFGFSHSYTNPFFYGLNLQTLFLYYYLRSILFAQLCKRFLEYKFILQRTKETKIEKESNPTTFPLPLPTKSWVLFCLFAEANKLISVLLFHFSLSLTICLVFLQSSHVTPRNLHLDIVIEVLLFL